MAVASDAQQTLDGIVIDDEKMVKAAVDLDRLRADQEKRKERIAELSEYILQGIAGKSEDGATFHIGPITVKQVWKEREAETKTVVREIAEQRGYVFQLKLGGVEAIKQARREAKKAAKQKERERAKAARQNVRASARRGRAAAIDESEAMEHAEEAAQAERNERVLEEAIA